MEREPRAKTANPPLRDAPKRLNSRPVASTGDRSTHGSGFQLQIDPAMGFAPKKEIPRSPPCRLRGPGPLRQTRDTVVSSPLSPMSVAETATVHTTLIPREKLNVPTSLHTPPNSLQSQDGQENIPPQGPGGETPHCRKVQASCFTPKKTLARSPPMTVPAPVTGTDDVPPPPRWEIPRTPFTASSTSSSLSSSHQIAQDKGATNVPPPPPPPPSPPVPALRRAQLASSSSLSSSSPSSSSPIAQTQQLLAQKERELNGEQISPPPLPPRPSPPVPNPPPPSPPLLPPSSSASPPIPTLCNPLPPSPLPLLPVPSPSLPSPPLPPALPNTQSKTCQRRLQGISLCNPPPPSPPLLRHVPSPSLPSPPLPPALPNTQSKTCRRRLQGISCFTLEQRPIIRASNIDSDQKNKIRSHTTEKYTSSIGKEGEEEEDAKEEDGKMEEEEEGGQRKEEEEEVMVAEEEEEGGQRKEEEEEEEGGQRKEEEKEGGGWIGVCEKEEEKEMENGGKEEQERGCGEEETHGEEEGGDGVRRNEDTSILPSVHSPVQTLKGVLPNNLVCKEVDPSMELMVHIDHCSELQAEEKRCEETHAKASEKPQRMEEQIAPLAAQLLRVKLTASSQQEREQERAVAEERLRRLVYRCDMFFKRHQTMKQLQRQGYL